MSSPRAADVVRRRSTTTCDAVSLHTGMRNGSRQGEPRVKITRLRSSVETAVAPGKLTVVTVTESCRPRLGAVPCARSDQGKTTTNDAAMRRRWCNADLRTDGVRVGVGRTRPKSEKRAVTPSGATASGYSELEDDKGQDRSCWMVLISKEAIEIISHIIYLRVGFF